MNQSQIEDLSTEEYSYFLAYGDTPLYQPTQCTENHFREVLALIHSIGTNEAGDSDDERELSQGSEDVCSSEGHDGIGCVLQDDPCTYTQRSTCE